MLPEEENNSNKIEQSEPLLERKDAPVSDIPLWKRIVLFVVGLGGLYLIALLVSIPAIFVPTEYQDSFVNIVTYVVLFCALVGIVVLDIPKHLSMFKKCLPYLIGFGLGAGIIVFDIFYTTIVSQFYKYSINENEEGVRSIIDVMPVAAVFVLGIIGPLCEELTYRVGLFGALKKVSVILAYIVTIIVFGAIHFRFNSSNIYNELVNLPVYLVSGAVLTFAYDKWGFTASATAHITNNLYAILMNIILKYIS